jgi:hypothetical protein
MPGETSPTEGGKIRLGALARQSSYVLGVTPKLTGAEEAHLGNQDFLPEQLLGGADYDLVVYRIADFLNSPDFPDEAFVNFAQEVSQGLGERALSQEVKYIHLTPK